MVGKYISLESKIAKNKNAYYDALEKAQAGWDEEKEDPVPFIKYLLSTIISAYIIPLLSIVIISTIVIISMIGISNFLKKRECSKQNPTGTVLKVRKANKLSSEFLLAYILPLIAFDFSDLKSIVLFLTYFAILAFLCIRNNNIYTNIFLEFKKYRMYLCDIERSAPGDKKIIYYDGLIISRDDLTLFENKDIKYWDCDNYIYIHIKENDNNE